MNANRTMFFSTAYFKIVEIDESVNRLRNNKIFAI